MKWTSKKEFVVIFLISCNISELFLKEQSNHVCVLSCYLYFKVGIYMETIEVTQLNNKKQILLNI